VRNANGSELRAPRNGSRPELDRCLTRPATRIRRPAWITARAEAEWPVVARGQTDPEADNALHPATPHTGSPAAHRPNRSSLPSSLNNLYKMVAERTERYRGPAPTPARPALACQRS